MKYTGIPGGMWLSVAGSFKKHPTTVLGYDMKTAGVVTTKAKPKYKEIIGSLPEFENLAPHSRDFSRVRLHKT